MRDSRMHIIAGIPGPVPGTSFVADGIHNTTERRLLYTPVNRQGKGIYILQQGHGVAAGEYIHAVHHPTNGLFHEPRHSKLLGTRDAATNHVGDIAIALTDGGWDLLEALEAAHQEEAL